MRTDTHLAVADHEGIERPALLVANHPGVGMVVDWLRTAREEVVHPDRVRVVNEAEWDLGCEFDAFSASCFKCGQLKPDPRPFGLCSACQTAERAPQGEQDRLFTPAPTQLDGQLSL